jgi:DNA-binding MarR family transcriptional regulator
MSPSRAQAIAAAASRSRAASSESLPTVSGVLADLDRAGYVERQPDPDDRRRIIARITPAKASLIAQWLDGAASPIARVLDQLDTAEQEAFLKAMSLLETELRAGESGQ